MEDIDELRRALEAANMRAAAAEAVASQAEARVAEVEDELRRLQAQRQAERGVNPNQPKPKPSDGSLSAYGAQLARYESLERELERELMRRELMRSELERELMRRMMEAPSFAVMDEFMVWDTGRSPRPTTGRLSRRGGRRVTMHCQASNGSVMLRADTGNYDMAANSAEYICLQIDRHMRPTDVEVKVVNFVQELDRAKRITRPTQAIKDIMTGIQRARSGKDYTVEIE